MNKLDTIDIIYDFSVLLIFAALITVGNVLKVFSFDTIIVLLMLMLMYVRLTTKND
ncbi:MAG: hypothetical protein P1Q69_09885 [Candidatus Thorarchaeota archaeon]|nr:hypothetical protein [Candidatus Thorarchaeota archaeon]